MKKNLILSLFPSGKIDGASPLPKSFQRGGKKN